MKIGWWAEASITPDTFVFGTPNNHVPLIREAERRGHVVELIHVPWKVDGEYVLELEEWARLRPPQVLEDAIARRKALERLVAENSGLDATVRTFDAAIKELDENENAHSLDHDVIFMKLPPPGFLRTKLEVVYNMWRFARAGIPVFVLDGDLMWDQAVDWLTWRGVIETAKIHARTPYYPKKILPNWKFKPYWYDAEDELPLLRPSGEPWAKPLGLGYVGNDWKAEGSPRATGVAKFYGAGDAVWGRWTPKNRAATGLPADVFRGPVNAAHVRLCYQACRASVVLGLPAYYRLGLVTQRYREVIQAGALCLIDAAYDEEITDLYVDPKYRVKGRLEAAFVVNTAVSRETYLDELQAQRAYVKARPELRLETWVDELEQLGRSPL